MIRTGVFGGSFNPIHNGHIALALQLLKEGGLEEIWFMVSPQNPLKTRSSLLDDATRLRLVRAALEDYPQLKACDYESHMPVPSYTYDTLLSMGADFPDRELVLLMGADNWKNFHRWYRNKDIVDNYNIIIYPREGAVVDPITLPRNARLVDTPLYNISSTDIRRRIKEGQDISSLVPLQVATIIAEEGLYGVTS